MKHILFSGLIGLACLAGTTSQAASVQSYAQASAGGCGSTSTHTDPWSNSGGAVAAAKATGTSGCDMSSNAGVGAGHVGITVSGGANAGVDHGSSTGQAVARAQYTFNLATPPGANGPVGMKVNALAHGVVEARQFIASYTATATASLEAILTVSYFDWNLKRERSTDMSAKAEVFATSNSLTRNAVDSQGLDAALTSGWLTIDPTKEVKVQLHFRGGASYTAHETASGLAAALGGNTLSFAPTAFEFSATGYSVTDANASIVNNQWIDPRQSAPAVPLPAPALLLIGGLGALSALRRRG